jgi:subtilisin family serine protease
MILYCQRKFQTWPGGFSRLNFLYSQMEAKMGKQNSKQSQYKSDGEPNLIDVREALSQEGYSPEVIENYQSLTQKDLRLAEIYRLSELKSQISAGDRQIILNPVQASVNKKGEVWVNVLVEVNKKGVARKLKKFIKFRGRTKRYVAGRVLASRLPELLSLVSRVQAAKPIAPLEYVTIPRSIQADPVSLSALPLNLGEAGINGNNVIVGIIDFGCDYRHPNFIKQNNTTRLLYLWDQNGKGGKKPKGFAFGNEYDANDINDALNGFKPPLKYSPENDAHGTHVMDIAAGSSPNYPGVAPDADLIFVHLGKPTNPKEEELKTLGSSSNLLDAVRYIFGKADELNKPAVVNISLGANGGNHDGTSLVESAFDDLLNEKPGRAIVIAAGNSYDDKIHAKGKITTNGEIHQSQILEWFILNHVEPHVIEDDLAWGFRQELEIWYDKDTELTVKLFDPTNALIGECPLGETRSTSIAGVATQPVIISHLPPDQSPGEDENHINIFIDNHYRRLNLGGWKIQLSHALPAPQNDTGFNAWIERNDIYPSRFSSEGSQPDHTINSIGNAKLPIVVGAYNAREAGFPICYFSSGGPSRNKDKNFTQKPELSAPGWNIFSARANDSAGGGFDASGTSMAAPHVTGLIALMFQAARDHRVPSKILSMPEIRQILRNTADRNPPENGAHDPRYGFGRVNGFNAISMAIQ